MFEMSTCHLNFFRLWHNGTFFATFYGWRMGVERQGKWGHGVNNEKKKKWYIYFCLLHKCLVGWGKICLLVCENHSLIILFMAKNHKQVEQSYVLRAGMIAMCTFLFVLYNVNMIISKLTFWDMVGFWMKV